MVSRPCRECGQAVSDTAKVCPDCGASAPALSAKVHDRNMTIMGWAFASPFIGLAVLATFFYAWPLVLIGAVIWAIVCFTKKRKGQSASGV